MVIECARNLPCAATPRAQVVVQYLPVVRYYRRLEAESKAAKPDADVCAAPATRTHHNHASCANVDIITLFVLNGSLTYSLTHSLTH